MMEVEAATVAEYYTLKDTDTDVNSVVMMMGFLLHGWWVFSLADQIKQQWWCQWRWRWRWRWRWWWLYLFSDDTWFFMASQPQQRHHQQKGCCHCAIMLLGFFEGFWFLQMNTRNFVERERENEERECGPGTPAFTSMESQARNLSWIFDTFV